MLMLAVAGGWERMVKCRFMSRRFEFGDQFKMLLRAGRVDWAEYRTPGYILVEEDPHAEAVRQLLGVLRRPLDFSVGFGHTDHPSNKGTAATR
jgi:hypothetical protein